MLKIVLWVFVGLMALIGFIFSGLFLFVLFLRLFEKTPEDFKKFKEPDI